MHPHREADPNKIWGGETSGQVALQPELEAHSSTCSGVELLKLNCACASAGDHLNGDSDTRWVSGGTRDSASLMCSQEVPRCQFSAHLLTKKLWLMLVISLEIHLKLKDSVLWVPRSSTSLQEGFLEFLLNSLVKRPTFLPFYQYF